MYCSIRAPEKLSITSRNKLGSVKSTKAKKFRAKASTSDLKGFIHCLELQHKNYVVILRSTAMKEKKRECKRRLVLALLQEISGASVNDFGTKEVS